MDDSGRRRSRSFLGESGELRPDQGETMSASEQALLFVPAQWKFGQKLGKGTFGTVWSGVFKPTGNTYAVKKIRQGEGATMEDTQREVALMASLGGHRNIVRYFGGQLVLPGGFFWIVMENMECGTLDDVMKVGGGPLNELEAAPVVRDVCAGLGYLHKMGVLHKDIKAQNILIGSKCIAKLADFGVSQKESDGVSSSLDNSNDVSSRHGRRRHATVFRA